MLSQLFVRDLVIVDRLELELSGAMTALTGETGAGKSILIDALGLVLGDKADPDLIAWLAEQALDDGDECLVRRVLQRGRSRAYINARPATGLQLQALGERLVDIHGQHAHQSLLRPAAQRDLLDSYAGHGELAAEVAARFRDFRALDERLRRLTAASAERAARLDLLRYQVDELRVLGLDTAAIAELEREHRRLTNLGELQATTGGLIMRLYDGDPSLHGELSRCLAELDALLAFDERLGATRELLDGAGIQIDEAVSALRQYLDGLDVDPAQMALVEARLTQVHDLARKYRVPAGELPAKLAGLAEELAELERDDRTLDQLTRDCAAAREAFLASARTLSGQRRAAAERLSATVTEAMQGLAMVGGCFAVEVTPVDPDGAGAFGLDRVELLVSANPGQPLAPLAKVASGGELSRISLGIQVATAQTGSIPTLVFDEVDVGIGGGVAEIVGRLLRTLGEARQVLCVTHLPQVAAQAHHHLRVRKLSRDGATYTVITALAEEERVGEIARMLGGREITAKTLDHAREMVARAQARAPA
ncbi:MAG: DNA repair protein RecN [Chromatiaceae bacterium]|nr:DNA repair protein RecN [Chromatiaceae bacterium]